MKRTPIPLMGCITMIGLGCESQPGPPEFVERDSAGIRIVEYATLDTSRRAPFPLAPGPTVVLGDPARGPQEEWSDISTVRLSDGRIVVSDNATKELRYFDAHGRHVASVGRRGEGPGEFGSIRALVRTAGDSVLAQDGYSARAALFGPGAGLHRAITLGDGRRIDLVGRFEDGAFVATTFVPGGGLSVGPRARLQVIHRLSAGGGVEQQLGRIIEREFLILAWRGQPAQFLRPFGRVGTVRVAGDHYLVGDGTDFEIREHATDGRLVRVLRVSGQRRPVTDRDRSAERDRVMALYGRGGRDLEYYWEHAEWPRTIPAFHRFETDGAGRLWAEEFPSAERRSRWLVFDEQRRYLGYLDVPGEYDVRQIDGDGILAIRRDRYGVEQVVFHEFGGGARQPRRGGSVLP